MFEDIFEKLCMSLNDCGNINKISKEFMHLDNNYERIKFILDLQPLANLVQLPEVLILDKEVAKSFKKSTELRTNGNQLFKIGQYNEALIQYSKSLSYAPILDDRRANDQIHNSNVDLTNKHS